jgi:Subtilase family/PA domain
MIVSPDKIAAIAALPGVKAVHPMNPKYLVTTFSDIDFLNTRPAWTTGPFGTHGENVKVADIDTGLDYIHRNFGGSGANSDYTSTSDTSAVPNANFPTPKIPGGIDLVGDAYTGSNAPVPDNNPLDCNGHGTATASLIAGFGETNAGFTYSGTYDASNPDMSSLKIPPGFAPNAKIYPVRVFGCSGSTNVVVQALEWAMDPNGDGNFSDHMDVVNMSLGANNGFADDPDDIAATIAAQAGIIICSAAGNAGDSYYIHSSPAAASGTLGVAASFNDQNGFIFDGNVTMGAPPSIAGQVYAAIFGAAPVPHTAVATNNIVYAIPNDGSPDQGAGPYTPYSNAANIAGKICLVDRGGGIGFATKIGRAKASGAIAVIANNFNNPGQPPIVMGGLNGNDNIPAVMISRTDRDTIVAAAGGFDGTTGLPTNPTTAAINLDNGVVTQPTNPPGSAAVAGSPDTIASYSARGPRLPDSATKPDITAPAEVTAVAVSAASQNPVPPFAGTAVENFNGTSSATPHVAGEMALLKQLHSTWSVQELLALACNNSNHDIATTVGGATLDGVGRVGAGRIDVGKAAAASVVAYNGTDPNLQGVSFGVVEVPVDGSTTLTKNITVTNKGATNITYNTSIANNPAVAGATFTVSPANFTINAGTSTTLTVTFTGTGSTLKHAREGSVAPTQGGTSPTNGNPRQWLTEAGGYVVLTPTDSSPVLRVEVYAAPKPASSMHATTNSFVPTNPNTGSFNINLSGSSVNTGASLGNGFDIVSLVKAFEGQFQSPFVGQPNAPTNRNMIKYVGVTSDYVTRVPNTTARIVFGIEGFGGAAEPSGGSSDKEILVDTGDGAGGPPDGIPDFQIFLTRNGTGQENVYVTAFAKLHSGGAFTTGFFTNGLNAGVADTNAYNNSCITMPISASSLADTGYPALGTAGHTFFQYQVVTFDRNGNPVDETPVLSYDLANPGLEVENSANVPGVSTVFSSASANVENFMYKDVPSNFIPVNYNGTNFRNNGSIGVLLFHMHNADGNRADMVAFRKPTISGFSPSHGPVGTQVTINGGNFNSGTGVDFHGTVATSVTVITANTLIATVPAGATTGRIHVFNAAGTSTSSTNFSVP